MTFNQRLFKIYDSLKKRGDITSYVHLGEVIGENKAGVNDLKTGRKKATLEHFQSLKKSYPDINSDYILTLSGEMFVSTNENKSSYYDQVAEKSSKYGLSESQVIAALKETVDSQKVTIATQQDNIEALKMLIKANADFQKKAISSTDPHRSI